MDLISNKRLGSNWEKEYAEILRKQGYWVTLITPKQYVGSQPCDIIAIKDNFPMLVDCKTLKNKNGLFPISRIEDNQIQAFKKYKNCNNTNYILAIKFNDRVYEINLNDIDFKQKNIDLKGGTYENYSIEQY